MRLLQALLFLATLSHAAGTATRPGLAWSKSFGGQSADYGTAVATDSSGNIYVAGNVTSLDFPVKNALQPHMGGAPLRASSDSGATWTVPSIPDSVYAIAGSAKAPGVLYAGTATTIYKSSDSGKTWSALPHAPNALVNALVVDASNPAIVYAGTAKGIFKSPDAGATWSEIDPAGWYILDLVSNPARPSTLFAGIFAYPQGDSSGNPLPQTTVYRSTDSGATWTPLSNLPGLVVALACDPSNPDVLYASANPAGFLIGDPRQTAIYKTTDAGNTWQKVTTVPVANSTFALAVSPTAVFAATTTGLIRSTDGGATWKPTSIAGDTDNVAVDATNPQTVYASAGGIWVSTDSGATWKLTLPIRQNVQTVVAPPGNPGLVFLGATPGQTIFISKWSGDGKQMLWSTYLGGSYYDVPTGLAVDRQGNAYVTGYTYATDFPVTAGAFQSKTTAAYTGFVSKISADGTTLLYSTYLSGTAADAAFAVAVDSAGSAYVTGYATSPDFPSTPGTYQSAVKAKCVSQSANPPSGDAFVTKLSSDGRTLAYSTLLGGNCGEEGLGIAVDPAGNAFVSGITESSDFPVTPGAYRQKWPGVDSGFIAKLSPQGNSLVAASLVGESGITTADGVTLDPSGAVYLTGCSRGGQAPGIAFGSSGSSPASPGIGDPCFGAAYILKLDSALSTRLFLNYLGTRAGEGSQVAIDPSGNIWAAGFEDPFDTPGFPTVHPFQAGTGQGFVAQWSPDGATLLFSSQIDSAYSMALDPSGNVFVTGFTNPPANNFTAAVLLARIDAAVPAAVTIETPQRITPGPGGLQAPDLSVAVGEIVTIAGTGLGPAQTAGAKIGADGKVAGSLAGTTVTFDGIPAPLLSVQANQIVCVVPFEIEILSTTSVQVQANGVASNSILMPTGFTAVEAFAIANQDGAANSAQHPAAQGSIVTIYAAGIDLLVPPPADGQINTAASSTFIPAFQPSVSVLDCSQNNCPLVPADVLFAGPAPGQIAGIVQINFRLPPLPPGESTVVVGLVPGEGDYDQITVNVGR